MKIEIDSKSGFCFGVVTAIQKAEEELKSGSVLYCLGDIVHNGSEVDRLEALGLRIIDHQEFAKLNDVKVLLRAHGEPPSTYELAKKNNITLIDATCPVVLMLQSKIKDAYHSKKKDGQIVILGKPGHAEVNGLVGQTDNTAIVLNDESDLSKVDLSKDLYLFAQTTKSLDEFHLLVNRIESSKSQGVKFEYKDSICRQVSNRIPNIRKFASSHDLILFVGGKKSSNGKILYEECKKVNPSSFFISEPNEIDVNWFKEEINSVGICGATSTPKWLMEEVANYITNRFK
jgi:4-hydroxy-3-methylbut-2-enyl diphosphate reductase